MLSKEPYSFREECPELLYLDSWKERFPWLIAGFTTRHGGVSQVPFARLNLGLHVGDERTCVIQNRMHLAEKLGCDFASWTCADQAHSTNITLVTKQDRGKGRDRLETAIPNTDGLYTTDPDILLTSFYADCVPLLFVDPINQVVGMVHAGWKGTVGQIGLKLIERWQNEFNSKREEILVAIGPAIGGCCYEVDEPVIKHIRPFEEILAPQAVQPIENGKYLLDLKQVNLDFLLQAGILRSHIEVSQWCTSCDQHLFFSHRKENGKTGRMAAFIAIRESSNGRVPL